MKSIGQRDERWVTTFGLSKGNYSSNNEEVFKEDFGDVERRAYFAIWVRVLNANFSSTLWT